MLREEDILEIWHGDVTVTEITSPGSKLKHPDIVNLLELCGMLLTAWCLIMQERDLPGNEDVFDPLEGGRCLGSIVV